MMKHFMEGGPAIAVAAHTGDLCGECPVWDAAENCLYWTDCTGLKFLRYHWASEACRVLRTGVEVYGFRRNRPGGFVVTNTTGVWLWDGSGEMRPVATQAEGSRLQLNDCTADSVGRLLAGSFFYDPGASYPLGRLIRIETDGRAVVLDEGFHLSNGLGFSPDERVLYFTDSVARRIYAYDYDPPTGGARNRRIFVEVPGSEGIPDGLTVDSEGFVWSAQWYGSAVVRYDPDGREERRVAIPAKQTSSVTFGGPDLTEMFVTSAAKSEPMPVMPPGYDAEHGVFGGPLFRIRTGIQGLPAGMAQISLPG